MSAPSSRPSNPWLGRALYLVALLVFGILVPRWKGLEFLDILVILPYACISWVFAVPAVTSAVESAGLNRMLLRRAVAKAFLFAWGSSLLALGMGLATVNFLNWHGSVLLPSTTSLINAALIGLSGCLILTALATLLTLHFGSASKARNALRLVLMAGLLGIYFWLNQAPMQVRFSAVELLSSGSALGVALPFLVVSAAISAVVWRMAELRMDG